jgi:hypothetical protein
MAQLAGLRLRHRWDGWTGAPFSSESRQHVSVWEKPGPADGPSCLPARGDHQTSGTSRLWQAAYRR